MKTSVVMCTYNGKKYIIEQMDSLKNQTQTIDEVIICDDCSTDETVKLVRDYIESHELNDSWSIYVNEINKGYANNFHDALMMATGDVIFFCDQDDIWYSNKVEKMVSIMDQMPQICLLGSEFEVFISSGNAPNYNNQATDNKTIEKIELNRKTIFIENGVEGCTECMRRQFRDEIDQYWHEEIAHDEFVWKMALCYDGCYVYHAKLMDRRFHAENTSKQKFHDKEKRLLFLNRLYKSHIAMLKCAEKRLLTEDIKLINNNIKLVELRVDLLRKKNILSWIISVIGYLPFYQTWKSALVDLWIAVRR